MNIIRYRGTCPVPPPPFTLAHGDTVEIGIDSIGTLTNPVVRGRVEPGAVVAGA